MFLLRAWLRLWLSVRCSICLCFELQSPADSSFVHKLSYSVCTWHLQHSTAQHSTAQHSTAQHSTAADSPHNPYSLAHSLPTRGHSSQKQTGTRCTASRCRQPSRYLQIGSMQFKRGARAGRDPMRAVSLGTDCSRLVRACSDCTTSALSLSDCVCFAAAASSC